MTDPEFAAALERAIARSARRAQVVATVISAASAATLVGTWLAFHALPGAVFFVLAVVLGWAQVLRGNASKRALVRLRGAAPGRWLPSDSHGVVLMADGKLLAGGVGPVPLDKHSDHRVASASYDDVAHALTVDHLRLVREGNGEREHLVREVMRLPRSVTVEQAYAFAKQVLEASQR